MGLVPEKANIYKSIVFNSCRKLISEHRIKNYQNKNLCISCYEKIKN